MMRCSSDGFKVAHLRCSYVIGCNVARLVVHWLALKQDFIIFLGKDPIEVLLAEWTSDEENQETSAVISKCLCRGS
jgi:hypothetical protein